jgi:hypothetical protein
VSVDNYAMSVQAFIITPDLFSQEQRCYLVWKGIALLGAMHLISTDLVLSMIAADEKEVPTRDQAVKILSSVLNVLKETEAGEIN